MSGLPAGQFTGAFTTLKNRSIILGIQPVVTLCHELVANDEFSSRTGSDDATRDHFRQLVAHCDKVRKMITWNQGGVDIKSLPEFLDANVPQSQSPQPISMDHIQMSSTVEMELPWKLDGSDLNLPLLKDLHMRNALGPILYGAACDAIVCYTRTESRERSYMITVHDSLRVYSCLQTFRDLIDRLLGASNQIDIASPRYG